MSLPVQRLAGVQISLSLNVWKCSLANYIVNHLVVNNNITYYVSIGGVCGWRLIEAGSTSLSWTLGLGEAAFLVCIDKSVGTGNTNPTILFSLPKKKLSMSQYMVSKNAVCQKVPGCCKTCSRILQYASQRYVQTVRILCATVRTL